MSTALSWQEGHGKLNNLSLQLWWAKKHHVVSSMLNWLQQGKTHQVLLLSAKKRKLKLGWAQAQLYWTVEGKKSKRWFSNLQLLSLGELLSTVTSDSCFWLRGVELDMVFPCFSQSGVRFWQSDMLHCSQWLLGVVIGVTIAFLPAQTSLAVVLWPLSLSH